ncbi:hypothetical protein, partial [uncultured Flavobacterium sp.]|uniref:hypothetical protein n=1 Tax=uncultured Flavobacterium sp. TaxID=165435 RepID=UPI00259250AF
MGEIDLSGMPKYEDSEIDLSGLPPLEEDVKKKVPTESLSSGLPQYVAAPTSQSTLESGNGASESFKIGNDTNPEFKAQKTKAQEALEKSKIGYINPDLEDFNKPQVEKQTDKKAEVPIDDLVLRTNTLRDMRKEASESYKKISDNVLAIQKEGEDLIKQYEVNPTPQLKQAIIDKQTQYEQSVNAANRKAFQSEVYARRLLETSDSIRKMANDNVPTGLYEGLYKGFTGSTDSFKQSIELLKASKEEAIKIARNEALKAPTVEPDAISEGAMMVGGVVNDVLVGLGAGLVGTPAASIVSVSAKQGAQQAGEDFVRAFNQAEKEGFSEDEAYEIAKKSAAIGGLTGAAEGALGAATGVFGAKIGKKALTKAGEIATSKAVDIATDATIAGAMQLGRNAYDRHQGLSTELGRGVLKNMAGEALLGAGMGTVSGVKEYTNSREKSGMDIYKSILEAKKDNGYQLQKIEDNLEVLNETKNISKEDYTILKNKLKAYQEVLAKKEDATFEEVAKEAEPIAKQEAEKEILQGEIVDLQNEITQIPKGETLIEQTEAEVKTEALGEQIKVKLGELRDKIKKQFNSLKEQIENYAKEVKAEQPTVLGKEEGRGVLGDVEIKNEGKAETPTKENVQERLSINNPFYKKVEDALVKLGLIEKYNPETKTGDVVGGYVQGDGRGGFASGDMYFEANGVIKYRKDGNVVEFDRNGNVISENTKQVAQENKKIEIEATKSSIASLEKTRDSEAFKYKEVTESDALGNRKKVKRLKTSQELKESTDKINAAIDKAKEKLKALEQSLPTQEVKAEQPTVLGKEVEAKKADIERRRQEELKQEEYRITESSELYQDQNGDFYKVEKLANGKNKISISDENGKTLNILDTYDSSVSFDKIIDGGLTKVKDLKFTNKIVDKINAKYDAELKALEQSLPTQEPKAEQPTVLGKEEGSGVGGDVGNDVLKDVESTTKALEDISKNKPTIWQSVKDAFNKGVNKVFGGSLKMKDSEKLSPDKIKARVELIAQKLGATIEYKPHPLGAAFNIANDGKFYITIDPKLFDKGLGNQEAFNTINVIAHELGHAIDAKEVLKNNLSDTEISELAKLHRAFINTFNFDVGEDISGLETAIKNNNKNITGDEKATKISDLINPETNAHRHEQEELFADALRMMVISPELAKRLAPNLFERLSKHGLGDNEHQSIAEAYHDAKSKGIENDFTKAVEQSLPTQEVKSEPTNLK